MVRVLVASVVAAVLVFVWGAVSWLAVGWHARVMSPIPDGPVISAMQEHLPGSGVYYFPPPPAPGATPEQQAAFQARHATGPIGLLMFRKEGVPAMEPIVFAKGLAISAAAAFFAAIAARGCRTFVGRYTMVVCMALFAACVGKVTEWNYWYLPTPYTLFMSADLVIGWLIGGVAIAGIVKPSGAKN